jgi:hypothetical protein
LLLITGISLGVDGGSLRNEAGQHVLIGVVDGTSTIKWVKLTTEGYTITSVAPSASTAPTLAIANLTAAIAQATYAFGGNTALSFSVLNTTIDKVLYVGIATGGPYVTVYPHCSFSVPMCAEADIFFVGSAAATTFDIIYTY